jgi:ribosomal protein L13E
MRNMTSRPKIPASLIRKIQAAPHVPVRLIIRIGSKGPAEAAAELRARGIQVRYILGLINAIAVETRGEKVLTLAGETWIKEIEEDKEVRVAG